MISRRPGVVILAFAGSVLLAAAGLAAETVNPARVVETLDGRILAGEQSFDSWQDYAASEFFDANGKRCGLQRDPGQRVAHAALGGSAADCTFDITNPSAVYDPTVAKYRIPVVVHVIQNTSGSGFLSEAQVESQIDILNEDFLALQGSNGGNGADAQIEFFLATEDPSGNPTHGITYSTNNSWFNDSGAYWNTLAWDTHRYLNIYTNTAGGNLGYVPNLPQGGIAGSNEDRVVVLWSSFGRNGAIGPPFNQGRTATHEVGHYLGLDHTFGGGCGSLSACYTSGDLICDTNRQSTPTSGCTNAETCGSPDPIHNYMDYSSDLCMEEFTPEQSRRMRCSLENYRPDLALLGNAECGNGVVESGEECDDGNVAPLDGCDDTCRIENVPNDCCLTGHGSGCSVAAIQSCVCSYDPFCCVFEWEELCVELVEDLGCGACSVEAPAEVSQPGAVQPLIFASRDAILWEEPDASGASAFNLYLGEIGTVRQGDYGSCLQGGIGDPSTVHDDTPPSGTTWTYVVSGTNAVGEGTLGDRSDGSPRASVETCL